MAKYEIKHICGHTETVELQGSSESRQKKIAELERQVCDDCYNAKKEAEFVAKASKFLDVKRLPELVGTERQVAWAENLRMSMLSELFAAYEMDDMKQLMGSDAFRKAGTAARTLRNSGVAVKNVSNDNFVAAFKLALKATIADAVTATDVKFFIDNREMNYTLAAYFLYFACDAKLDDITGKSKLVHVYNAIAKIEKKESESAEENSEAPASEEESALDEVITAKEAAEIYGVNIATVRRWCTGQDCLPPQLPKGSFRKSGGTWLLLKKYTDALVKEKKHYKIKL